MIAKTLMYGCMGVFVRATWGLPAAKLSSINTLDALQFFTEKLFLLFPLTQISQPFTTLLHSSEVEPTMAF